MATARRLIIADELKGGELLPSFSTPGSPLFSDH